MSASTIYVIKSQDHQTVFLFGTAISAASWRDGLAERTGTIPNSHTAFPAFITPGRCLYITRTGLWLPVYNYSCPSGPRHVCHLKEITACSSSLLCFRTNKKASGLPAGLKTKMCESRPNSQSGALASGSNVLLPLWKLESEDLICPNTLLTCHVQSTLPHSPALYFSCCLWSFFFFWFALEVGCAEKFPCAPSHQDHLLYLDCGFSCQSQCNSRNTVQKGQHYGANSISYLSNVGAS